MIISFIIPAFKASETIKATLSSIFTSSTPENWSLDVIVVNDGSPDGAAQHAVVQKFSHATYLDHTPNQGKCAAVNLAVPKTRGDIIVMLDADDTLVPEWPTRLSTILKTWPDDAPICFSACRTNGGESTVSDPQYTGPLSLNDMLNERHMGEYLPIFRGDALRAAKGYRDPGEPSGCELWTYLGFAEHAQLWVSAEVMRIYYTDRPGSITASMYSPQMAQRVVRCYDLIFADFEHLYRAQAPRNLGRRRLRQAVFATISGQRSRAWSLWRKGANLASPLESIAALVLITLGPSTISKLVGAAKKARILRRYG